jgi:hypothetical protein
MLIFPYIDLGLRQLISFLVNLELRELMCFDNAIFQEHKV